MEILHTFWDENKLHLWLETTEGIPLIYREKLDLSRNYVKRYPYSRNINQLLKVLHIVGVEQQQYSPAQNSKLDLFLPTTIDDEAFPLYQLSQMNLSELDYKLKKYSIDSLMMSPYSSLDLLFNRKLIENNYLKLGDSTEFWILIIKFALKLISKEHYIPSVKLLSKDEYRTSFIGKWIALIQAEDQIELTQYIKQFPFYYQDNISSEKTFLEILHAFLNELIDGFVRTKLSIYLPKKIIEQNQDELFSLAQEWFQSLFTPQPQEISINNSDFIHFMGLINNWLESTNPVQLKRKFLTCLKLIAPNFDDNKKDWSLEYLLQAEDDSSLIIPAENIWNYNENTINFLEERFENPKERLLTDLAKALVIYPKIEESFENKYPSKIPLNKKEAFNFLENIVPLLQEKNYQIFLPSWWNNPYEKFKFKIKLLDTEPISSTESFFKLNEFLKFDWEIAIGDTNLTMAEFEKLSDLKIPFVNIRGKWIKFDNEIVNHILEEIKSTYNNLTYLDAFQLSLIENLSSDIFDLELDDQEIFTNFKTKIGSTSNILPLPTPSSFVGELRTYQKDGFSWINYLKEYGFGACLADDMGLGKTIQIIAFLLHEKEQNVSPTQPSLLICPTSIVGNWFKEVRKFAPDLRIFVHHGNNRPKLEDFLKIVPENDLIITTYNLALRDRTILNKITWENIIIDEAQNIKNPQTKQTKVIKSLPSNYRIALTGTPIENRLLELWSIIDFLNSGYLGSKKEFLEKFAIPIEKENKTSAREVLTQIVHPFILRRLKTNPNIIQDLPEKFENKIYCTLKEEQALLYEAIVKDLFNQLNNAEGIQRKGLVLATITKLKQICNHPSQFMHEINGKLENRSSKFERLEEMLLEIIENNERALIFTQYKELGKILKDYLEKKFGYKILFLSGDTPQKNREEMIHSFQDITEENDIKIFILSIKAGGVGLNLTQANHVFHIDRWWNPALENQATDRAYRIGQEKDVMVHKFICIGTLEESIDQLIEQKKGLANSIITTGDTWLTELSTEDLRTVLSLRSIF